MDSSAVASPNNSDLTHLARVRISGLSIARIDPARVLYIACMINPGSSWIAYHHQMKTVFIFTFVLDWKTRECKIRIRIRISSFLFSELRQDSIEEEEIIFVLFDFFAVHGKIKSKGL